MLVNTDNIDNVFYINKLFASRVPGPVQDRE